jgi:hypothetical protein
MNWRDVPITAGLLSSALEECMSEQLLVDFNVGGFLDMIATAIEERARKIADPSYESKD